MERRMSRAWIIAALALASCRQPAHIELGIQFACQAQGGAANIADAMTMDISCANFVEFMVYEDAGGKPGNLLGTDCLTTAQLGSPSTMIGLIEAGAPTRLLSNVPTNQSVIFRVRAIHAYDTSVGCNDDLAQQQPLKIFDGLSPSFTIDGNDHQVSIQVDECGSCGNIPATVTTACPLAPNIAPVTYDQTKYPGGQSCCPISQSSSAGCLRPGSKCGDGSSAQLLPGACCAYCPTGSAPAATSTGP
jgi:hypothetical protein